MALHLPLLPGFQKPLLVITLTGVASAALEVLLFGFLGNIVNWLSGKSPAQVFAEDGGKLLQHG